MGYSNLCNLLVITPPQTAGAHCFHLTEIICQNKMTFTCNTLCITLFMKKICMVLKLNIGRPFLNIGFGLENFYSFYRFEVFKVVCVHFRISKDCSGNYHAIMFNVVKTQFGQILFYGRGKVQPFLLLEENIGRIQKPCWSSVYSCCLHLQKSQMQQQQG